MSALKRELSQRMIEPGGFLPTARGLMAALACIDRGNITVRGLMAINAVFRRVMIFRFFFGRQMTAGAGNSCVCTAQGKASFRMRRQVKSRRLEAIQIVTAVAAVLVAGVCELSCVSILVTIGAGGESQLELCLITLCRVLAGMTGITGNSGMLAH